MSGSLHSHIIDKWSRSKVLFTFTHYHDNNDDNDDDNDDHTENVNHDLMNSKGLHEIPVARWFSSLKSEKAREG